MLAIDQDLHLALALLCSDRWLHFYLQQSVGHTAAEDVATVYTQAYRDHQWYQPHLHRPKDEQPALQTWQSNLTLAPTMADLQRWLKRLARRFLTWRGHYVEVKHAEHDAWMTLISKLDPSWLIAWQYNELLAEGRLTRQEAMACLAAQCPVALPKNETGQAIADNHVHLGGHGHYALSLLDCALYLKRQPSARLPFPYQPECTLLNQSVSRQSQLVAMFHQLVQVHLQDLFIRPRSQAHRCSHHGSKGMPSCPLPFDQVQHIALDPYRLDFLQNTQLAVPDAEYWVLAADGSEQLEAPQRWIALLMGLLDSKLDSKPKTNQHYRMALLHASMVLRNYMVHTGLGLTTFVNYFGFKMRRPHVQVSGVFHYKRMRKCMIRGGDLP